MAKIYTLCINWQKAKQEKPQTKERLKWVHIQAFNEGDDVSNYLQYFDKYDDGWRVYIYTSRKKAFEIFKNTMEQGN